MPNVQGTNLKEWEEQGIKIRLEEPMALHTSFKVGGKADLMAWVTDAAQLRYALGFAGKQNLPFWIIGRGTNLLVRDEGIKGIVVVLAGSFKKKSILEGEKEFKIVQAGAGMTLANFASFALNNRLTGMECLCGIPGTLGGALLMNAGAGGQEIGALVESVRFMDFEGNVRTLLKKEIEFSYRHSSLMDKGIVLSANLRLPVESGREILKKMRSHLQWRKERQPLSFPSAGSIFKNPDGASAGQLIESVGLKGKRVGGAEISEKHSNFIVNRGEATASDILQLMETAKNLVLEKTGVKLELEIKVMPK